MIEIDIDKYRLLNTGSAGFDFGECEACSHHSNWPISRAIWLNKYFLTSLHSNVARKHL